MLILAGCIPTRTEFYRPMAEIGKAVNDHCGTALAPKSTYKLNLGDVDFRVEGFENTLLIRFRIPAGVTIQINNDFVQILDEVRKYHKEVTFDYYDRESNETITELTLLIGANDKFAFGNTEPRVFSAHVKFERPMENAYQVRFSSITIDGIITALPTVRFKKDASFGLYPVNC